VTPAQLEELLLEHEVRIRALERSRWVLSRANFDGSLAGGVLAGAAGAVGEAPAVDGGSPVGYDEGADGGRVRAANRQHPSRAGGSARRSGGGAPPPDQPPLPCTDLTKCAWCGAPIKLRSSGRPRRFCSDRHRKAASRHAAMVRP